MRPVLHRGSRGEDVWDLQQQLCTLGYLNDDDVSEGAFTATFDSALSQAVSRFQARHGLDRTGICNRETWAAIEKEFDGI